MALHSVGRSQGVLRYAGAHQHDCWEIVLDLSGTGQTIADGNTFAFSPGNILCIPPHCVHSKLAANGFSDIFFATDTSPLLTETTEPIVLQLADDSDGSFRQLMELLYRTYHHGTDDDRLTAEAMSRAALYMLRGWQKNRCIDPLSDHVRNRLTALMSDPEVCVQDVLCETGYNADYVRRRFKAATGFSPNDYLTHIRITHARSLLEKNAQLHLSITEVALMCGYYDRHYFARVFRQETGMSPSEYLKTLHPLSTGATTAHELIPF